MRYSMHREHCNYLPYCLNGHCLVINYYISDSGVIIRLLKYLCLIVIFYGWNFMLAYVLYYPLHGSAFMFCIAQIFWCPLLKYSRCIYGHPNTIDFMHGSLELVVHRLFLIVVRSVIVNHAFCSLLRFCVWLFVLLLQNYEKLYNFQT